MRNWDDQVIDEEEEEERREEEEDQDDAIGEEGACHLGLKHGSGSRIMYSKNFKG